MRLRLPVLALRMSWGSPRHLRTLDRLVAQVCARHVLQGCTPLATCLQVDADSSEEAVKTARQDDKEELFQGTADSANHIGHAA